MISNKIRSRWARWATLAGAGMMLGSAITAVAAEPSPVREGKKRAILAYTLPAEPADISILVDAPPVEMPRAAEYLQAGVMEEIAEAMIHGHEAAGKPGTYSPGAVGDGQQSPVFIGRPRTRASAGEAAPEAHGSSNLPFSTARADGATGSTNTIYPWRATGRLSAVIPQSGPGTCSASLIKRGIVVTAAHCVAKFGVGLASNITFAPGFRNGSAPYGVWQAGQVRLLASYINGTDSCAAGAKGVICRNDIAVLTLVPKANKYPGTNTGWYGFGSGNTGFNGSGQTHITQLGYPGCLDNGNRMQRNDAQGSIVNSLAGNTVIGSLMCGGSSGGPWLINFGNPSGLTGTNAGSQTAANAVIGVTSWQSLPTSVKRMGASPFVPANIDSLVNAACQATRAACN